ncbi:MAG: SH3 domain-containing protein [Candidatus Riflebacteria bacterium]|nr:SH3 domain-containing protein [Candidatus Riflebacteria bacterium]
MKISETLLIRVIALTLPVLLLLAGMAAAVELNVAREGIVKNVPLQDPYNGCLIVREGPGMEYPVKGHVVNGDRVTIESTSGSWYKISAPKTGYVWASYISVTDSQTVDTTNLTRPLGLETIVENSDPQARDQKLPERQQLLETNQVIHLDIDREINP